MSLLALDWMLWAGGFAITSVLFSILLYRGRWRAFPCFTIYTGFVAILTLVMYVVFRFGSHAWYERFYYAFSFAEGPLQIASLELSLPFEDRAVQTTTPGTCNRVQSKVPFVRSPTRP